MTPIAIRLNFDMNFGDLCRTPHGEMVVKRQILVMGAIKRDTAWPEKRGKRVNTLKPLLWPDNDMAKYLQAIDKASHAFSPKGVYLKYQ